MSKEFLEFATHVNAANIKASIDGPFLFYALISFIFAEFPAYIRFRNINQQMHAIAAQLSTKDYPFRFSLTPLKSSRCPHNSSELLNT